MNKYILALLAFLIINCNFCCSQKKISIYLSEYDLTFTPQKKSCTDTIIRELEDERDLRISLFDCKGMLHLECFKNKKKIEEGDYINSLDLLKKYITRIDAINGNEKIKIYEYYQPIRTGTWYFYDLKGKLIREQIYKEGIIQNDNSH